MNLDFNSTTILSFVLVLIPFILEKYFSNKPKLIGYYGSISVHKITHQINNYSLRFIKFKEKPSLKLIEEYYKDRSLLIIQYEKEIWIYGFDLKGNTKLVQSETPKLYDEFSFVEDQIIEKMPGHIPESIYKDILSNNIYQLDMIIGTHEVVVTNAGKLPAHNVRLGHNFLPNYYISPSTQYEILELPNGNKELNFPILIQNEKITISYIYFPPVQYRDINTYIKSDEGFANIINVIPTAMINPWVKYLNYILLFIGSWTVIYYVIFLITCFKRCCCTA